MLKDTYLVNSGTQIHQNYFLLVKSKVDKILLLFQEDIDSKIIFKSLVVFFIHYHPLPFYTVPSTSSTRHCCWDFLKEHFSFS